MKKRRELDALVNGKLGRNKKKKGQHELLRNSESSDVEEFAIPNKPIRIRKHGRSSRLCATCVSVCGCFLLLASVIAIVGLVWVHLELKRDVDFLRSQLQKVESGSASNPNEFQDLHRKQQELEDSLSKMLSGKNGIQSHEANISSIFQQLKVLDQTTKGLSKSIGAAPQLEELPSRVEQLSEQTAEFGSKIATLQQSIDVLSAFQSSTEATLKDLQASKSQDAAATREGSDIPSAILQIDENLTNLGSKIDTMNTTANGKYLELKEQINKHTLDLQRLNTSVLNIEMQVQSLPTALPGEVAETTSQVQELISSSVEQLKLTMATKEELQILQNEVRNISSSLRLISSQHNTLTGASSEVTSADLDKLRGDMDQCCTKCAETMKSFNSSLEDLKNQISSQQPGSTDDYQEPTRDFIEKRPDRNQWEEPEVNDDSQDNQLTTDTYVNGGETTEETSDEILNSMFNGENDEGSTGKDRSTTTTSAPTSESSTTASDNDDTQISNESEDTDTASGPKVAARDLYKAAARGREGEDGRQHRAEASELLKKAIQESGNH